MFELLFLLLPVAAIYGYYMGKNSLNSKRQESKTQQSANYLKGFDYLLNNKQEKAVDKFIAFLNSKDPSFESSLALGNLFRQRGEVDKAIAVHEKMATFEDLEDAEREISQLELSRDFISAGFLDRAEMILLQLAEIPRQRENAAKLLLSVYEKEQDFKKAIDVANEYSDSLGNSVDQSLSQYHCEVAKSLIMQGMKDQAEDELKEAVSCYDKSVRARLELADLYIRNSDFNGAYKLIKEVSSINPDSGMICLEKLKNCFPNKADPNYRFALEDLVHRTNSAEAMVELVRTVELLSGNDDAQAQLMSFTKIKSNLKLFSELLDLRSHKADSVANESILQIKSLLDAEISLNNKYVCPHCGFESKILFWNCPSCRRWESMKPKKGLDGD